MSPKAASDTIRSLCPNSFGAVIIVGDHVNPDQNGSCLADEARSAEGLGVKGIWVSLLSDIQEALDDTLGENVIHGNELLIAIQRTGCQFSMSETDPRFVDAAEVLKYLAAAQV
jgi:hypothetical protein